MEDNYNFRYIETHIVDHCNLNCAYCFHYAPLAHIRFYDLEQFKHEVAQIATFMPKNFQFCILGGEPLLHPQFLDFCKIARQYFENVHIITNGLLLKEKSQEFFDTLNNLNISLEISNYTNQEWLAVLAEEKLQNYVITKKTAMANMVLDFNSPNSKEENFKHCGRPHCLTLRDGYLYRCSSDAWADFLFKYFNFIPNDYSRDRISIWNTSLEAVQEFCYRPVSFCKYCISNRFTDSDRHDWKTSKKELSEWVASLENTHKLRED